jgi:hypothetical protein
MPKQLRQSRIHPGQRLGAKRLTHAIADRGREKAAGNKKAPQERRLQQVSGAESDYRLLIFLTIASALMP